MWWVDGCFIGTLLNLTWLLPSAVLRNSIGAEKYPETCIFLSLTHVAIMITLIISEFTTDRLLFSRQMADLKESYEEKMDSTFEMYKEALKEHAYQCALERLEEEYVPLDEFTAEQDRAKVSTCTEFKKKQKTITELFCTLSLRTCFLFN